MGNRNHRQYIRRLIQPVHSGGIDPTFILTETEDLTDVLEAYQAGDLWQSGWL